MRNPSSRQKKPIHQSNSDFDYTIGTKRARPNKIQEKQDIPEVGVCTDPQPVCDPQPNYEPRPDELTSTGTKIRYNSLFMPPYIILYKLYEF
jgi:hypothetical protein